MPITSPSPLASFQSVGFRHKPSQIPTFMPMYAHAKHSVGLPKTAATDTRSSSQNTSSSHASRLDLLRALTFSCLGANIVLTGSYLVTWKGLHILCNPLKLCSCRLKFLRVNLTYLHVSMVSIWFRKHFDYH